MLPQFKSYARSIPLAQAEPNQAGPSQAGPNQAGPLAQAPSPAQPKVTLFPFYRPTDLAALYNFPKTYQPTGGVSRALNGEGKTIGIIQLGGSYLNTDLISCFGAGKVPNFVPYMYNVSTGLFDAGLPTYDSNDGANSEVALDMQIIGALVPKATIKIYFGYNPVTNDQYFYEAIQKAIQDNCSVISISWGNQESTLALYEPYYTQMNALFQTATTGSKKITIVAAAGDHGSSDESGCNILTAKADYPASSQFVLACGGTTLLADRITKKLVSEVVWNNNNGWATGGGISELFAKPSWQPDNKYFGATAQVKRGLPDVSGHADPRNIPYAIYLNGRVIGMGGTSAVSPLYASLALLLCQAKGSNVGLLQPLIYKNMLTVCRDITSGHNDTTMNGKIDYVAGKGWDACSGCGALNGVALLNSLLPKVTPKVTSAKKAAPAKAAPAKAAPAKAAPAKKIITIVSTTGVINKLFSNSWKK